MNDATTNADHARLPLHRDRHGRGVRGPVMPVAVPRYRSRSMDFDRAVLDAYAPLHNRFFHQLAGVDLAVDTIPRMRLSSDMIMPDEIFADGPVPLGRVLQAGVDRAGNPTRARIVVFRMPVEQRAVNAVERAELLTMVLTALVAHYLNLDPRDIDPSFQY
ncbi:metallopeptidase family protein [Corynebacterium sp. p3-SID1145]|uniref:metallopeptidase family protein n=1 Tax=unclassified Corynebacterium TaxID=2624378 RepID=UPI0021AA4D73|nr:MULTISPECIES: metallopeptidase family protein [unclassified Corynebacterium]MCT1451907.1 metallopeptidase family protein [Corynebacterium sp. p3-SID1145]MCT1461118.1 metallopeptidase family protein [Corynebacterium sp. p3-SID1140]